MGLRLFLAVDLPPAIAPQLLALCQGLAGARWSNPAQLHLTLRFLGDTPEEELPALRARLGAVAVPAFALGLRGVGVFPKKRRPARVLWTGVAPAEPVVALRTAIDQVLGPDPEEAERGFSPHLTLARFRDDPGRALEDYLERWGAFASATWPVEAFHLYRSTLGRDGAVHDILQSYRLGTP
jgi:RNA 2',3'-cyclic 3'-phosphodiesterase